MAMLEKIFLILSILATMAASGVFVYTEYLHVKPVPTNAEELERMKAEIQNQVAFKTFKLKKITTNLYSRKTRLRYLNLEPYIQPFEEKQIKALEENESLIYDAIITSAGYLQPEELNTLAGKILFENRIKNAINELYETPHVKKVFFSVFVVQ